MPRAPCPMPLPLTQHSALSTQHWFSPHLAALLRGAHHLRAGRAAERLRELRHVRDRSDDAVFGDRMRVAAELAPGDEELLIGREAVDVARRVLLPRLLQRAVGDVRAAEIADRFAEDELALVMDTRLDGVLLELLRHARGPILKALQ